MTDISNTCIGFKSNLQVVIDDKTYSYDKDKHFLASIHDPLALNLMKEHGINFVNALQRQEYEKFTRRCLYAMKGDYPFGTIGNKLVCRCINAACQYFAKCRPDYQSAELEAVAANKKQAVEAARFEAIWHDMEQAGQSKTGIAEAANMLVIPSATEVVSMEPAEAAIDMNVLPAEESKLTGEPVAPPAEEKNVTALQPAEPEQARRGRRSRRRKLAAEAVQAAQAVPEADPVKAAALSESKADPVAATRKFDFNSFKEVEQSEVIELPVTERTIINAGPGTGKTWTLIERMKQLLVEQLAAADEILVLCFSRSAVATVKERLLDAAEALPDNWRDIEVRTFDSFVTYMLAVLQDAEDYAADFPANFVLGRLNYNTRISLAVELFNKHQDLLEQYKHLIVDEVQDLVGVRAELVLSILKGLPDTCGFTLLGDACQSLYDYQADQDKAVMPSVEFYHKLFTCFPEANYFSFTRNCRQEASLADLIAPYRKAILADDKLVMEEALDSVLAKLPLDVINLKTAQQDDFDSYMQGGTLGILTRTNSQALQVSSWLRTCDVKHNLQKAAHNHDLAGWIGFILQAVDGDVITEAEFAEIYEDIYYGSAYSYRVFWQALLSVYREDVHPPYYIRDILRGLLTNAKDPLLFREPDEEKADITVSNIHRAKGQEFDSVFLAGDVQMVIDDQDDYFKSQQPSLENKVWYVALTRARKQLARVSLDKEYIYISPDEGRRCYRAKAQKKNWNLKTLTHMEIGLPEDIEDIYFAQNADAQDYIQDILEPGEELELYRCPEGTADYVVYKIYPRDTDVIIGYTGKKFAESLDNAFHRIWHKNNPVKFKYYPDVFRDVFVDSLKTCIAVDADDLPEAKHFGELAMWQGFSICGFAYGSKNSY